MRISDWSSDVCSSDLLPIGSLDIEDVSIRFSGDHCGHAEGRVRAHVAGQVAGLNLSQGLSGFATCAGETVLLPLVSQSGMEKDRKSVVWGKCVLVRVDLGGRRCIKKKNNIILN